MRISVFISMIAAIYVGENMNLVKNSVIRVFHKIFFILLLVGWVACIIFGEVGYKEYLAQMK